MELLKLKYPTLICLLISFYSCAPPAPIRLDDDPYRCAWNQGGGGYSRASSVFDSDDGIPELRWVKKQKTPLLLEPTLACGVLALPTTDNKLNIISLKTGVKVGVIKLRDYLSAPCAISDSLLIANEGGEHLTVINWVTCERIWSANIKYAETEPLMIDNRLIWQDGGKMLRCFALREGNRIWDKKLEYRLAAAPAADSASLVIAGKYGNIEKLSLSDGASIWLKNLDYKIRNSPIIVGNFLIIASSDGRVAKLSLADGSLLWEIHIGYPLIAPLAADEEGLFYGTSQGKFGRINFLTGLTDWEFTIDGPIKAGATILGNIVVFVSLNHRAYFVDKNDGSIRYEYQAQGMLTTRPAACSNRIYIAGEDKNLYCFQVSQYGQRDKTIKP